VHPDLGVAQRILLIFLLFVSILIQESLEFEVKVESVDYLFFAELFQQQIQQI
jgi:hypothetical protein